MIVNKKIKFRAGENGASSARGITRRVRGISTLGANVGSRCFSANP